MVSITMRAQHYVLVVAAMAWAIGYSRMSATGAEPAADQPGPYHVVKELDVGGEGRWDYVAVDSVAKLLYVPRSTHTQIIREETGEVVGDLKDTPGVHGTALVPDLGRGFTSNGRGNSVTVFDLKTLQVLGTVPTGQNPDAIIYDPASKSVFAFDGRGNDATVIDPAAAPAMAGKTRIPLPGRPEYAAADGRGRVFVNLEDKRQVAVIDTTLMKTVAFWKIEGGESPSGLAIDPDRHRLFVGCHNQVMAILDAQSGKTLGTAPIGKGVDACAFDPQTHEAFASCGDGTLTVVKESSDGKFEVTQTVHTLPGARTMGLDTKTHTIYLPAMKQEPGAQPAAGGRGAGKFVIVVVARSAE